MKRILLTAALMAAAVTMEANAAWNPFAAKTVLDKNQSMQMVEKSYGELVQLLNEALSKIHIQYLKEKYEAYERGHKVFPDSKNYPYIKGAYDADLSNVAGKITTQLNNVLKGNMNDEYKCLLLKRFKESIGDLKNNEYFMFFFGSFYDKLISFLGDIERGRQCVKSARVAGQKAPVDGTEEAPRRPAVNKRSIVPAG